MGVVWYAEPFSGVLCLRSISTLSSLGDEGAEVAPGASLVRRGRAFSLAALDADRSACAGTALAVTICSFIKSSSMSSSSSAEWFSR